MVCLVNLREKSRMETEHSLENGEHTGQSSKSHSQLSNKNEVNRER